MSEALTIEELERQAAEAEAAAAAVELSEEEHRRSAAMARIEKALEAKRTAEKRRRDIDRIAREEKARAAAGTRYLVRGIDLVDPFPPGSAPPNFPGGGVIIVRSPERERYNAANADIEHKKRPLADILTELFLDCVVDPDPQQPGVGMLLRAFCERYPGAALTAGHECYNLGGGKVQAYKRGVG